MTDTVVKTKTGNVFISPVGFNVYAQDYLEAFDAYITEKPFSPAKYYLVCRSLELSLKAYLLTEGIKRNKLKSREYGHNLHALLRKCKELRVQSICPLSEEEQKELEKANNWYNRKGFEYFELKNLFEGKDTLPDLEVLSKLANRLVDKLKPICLKAEQEL